MRNTILRKKMRELMIHKANVEYILGMNEREKEKVRVREREEK